jgi:hypothetical protein
MLSPKDLTALLEILGDDKKTLDQQAGAFYRIFPKTEHFKLGCGLYVFICSSVLELKMRLSAFYVLYDMYRAEPLASNPFLPGFLDTLQKPTIDPCERYFLYSLLSSPSKEVSLRDIKCQSEHQHYFLGYIHK